MSNPNPEGEEKMFVSEYDERQLRELVTGVALPAALILFFHIYMGAIVPLISTTLLTLTRLYENKLVKVRLGQCLLLLIAHRRVRRSICSNRTLRTCSVHSRFPRILYRNCARMSWRLVCVVR
jgi:hypothetical protein